MKVVRTVEELRGQVAVLRQRGKSVALVPTMGALHAGHVALLRRARAECDAVVLSIFVNPAQFNDSADLAAYPRTETDDLAVAEQAGTDLVFAPPAEQVYPPGFSATVALHGPMVDTFEGAMRGSAHFAGVTTVVSKLFHMVGPDRAYFGQKDAQQLRVVGAMVTDLDMDVEIVAVQTVREPDGLALSSRNVRLAPAERESAVSLSRGLEAARVRFDRGERSSPALIAAAREPMAAVGIEPEYLAVVDDRTFLPVQVIGRPAVLVVAAPVGGVRLIDNIPLPTAGDGKA